MNDSKVYSSINSQEKRTIVIAGVHGDPIYRNTYMMRRVQNFGLYMRWDSMFGGAWLEVAGLS